MVRSMTQLRGRVLLVALFGFFSAAVVNGQALRRWLEFRSESQLVWNNAVTEFAINPEPGLNAPARFELGVIAAELKDPAMTVFTSGAHKSEADRFMSKVLPSFNTRWGKQFVYDEPKFEAIITFVQGANQEIGFYMKISRTDYSLLLHEFEALIRDAHTKSNTGTRGEYAYVLSREAESFLYSPASPVPYSNYHTVLSPESPLQTFITPKIGGVALSFGKSRMSTFFRGEEDGVEFTHNSLFGLANGQLYGEGPRVVSRSSGRADLDYIAGLTSKISSTFVPAQAVFVQMSKATDFVFDIQGTGNYDVDFQVIFAVDAMGRLAAVVNIGESRETDSTGGLVFEFWNIRNYPSDRDRSYENSERVIVARGTKLTSNVDIPGTWVFVVSENSRELLYNSNPPVVIEDPPLYKFCTGDNSGSPPLSSLGWKGRFRKKALRYLKNKLDDSGLVLSHYAAYQLRRGGSAMENYNIGVRLDRNGVKATLRRMCVVSSAKAMNRIAKATTAAGLDDTLVPEMALVFEYNVVLQTIRGRPSFAMEQIFASYDDRETIAVITNYPSYPTENPTEILVWATTQCGHSSVSFGNNASNGNVDGRFVTVFDGSKRYRSVAPSPRYHASTDITCDDYAGPCNGECPAGFSCQTQNGKNFCVNCGLFERVDFGGSCCKVVADTNQCGNNLNSRERRKCFVAEPDFFELTNGREKVLPATFPKSVCGNRRNFLRNGGGCVLQNTFNPNGDRKCSFPQPAFFKPA